MSQFAYASRPAWDNRVELRFGVRSGGSATVARPVMYAEVQPGQFVEPTAILDEGAAQQLCDELWRAGFRPTQSKAGAGQFDAQQSHIADLSKLVHGSVEALQKIAVEGMGIR